MSKKHIVVIGDAILDRRVTCKVKRIASEAPVVIGEHISTQEDWGGAANVAANCAKLGARVSLLLVINGDTGDTLANGFKRKVNKYEDLKATPLVCMQGLTPAKTRFVAESGQMMFRFDEEQRLVPEPLHILTWFNSLVNQRVDALVLVDYDKGTLDRCVAELCRYAKQHSIPCLAGAKPNRVRTGDYGGVDLLVLNENELRELGSERSLLSSSWMWYTCNELRDGGKFPAATIVTTGSRGCFYFHAPEQYKPGVVAQEYPTRPVDVFDVTGAGDTFLAALAVEVVPFDVASSSAIAFANAAAGVAVGKHGTYAVSRDEVLAELADRKISAKIVSPDEAGQICAAKRGIGFRTVLANGCFDVLHAGHCHLISHAAQDDNEYLILAVNTDASVTALKGPERPLLPLDVRLRAVAAMPRVNLVTWFDEKTPNELLKKLRPDVLVKGDEYAIGDVVGAEYVSGYGGTVRCVPMLPDVSTTKIVASVKDKPERLDL